MNSIHLHRGISLIEVMVVFAITSVLLAATLPNFQDYTIRTKVGEGLRLAASAQEALVKTCESDKKAIVRNNLDADYFYIPSGTDEDFVNRILLGADCANHDMVIVLWTGNTGANTDPIIELSAVVLPDPASGDSNANGQYFWNCRVIRGESGHVPSDCRNRYRKT